MKKNFFYMMLVALLPLAFVACSSDDDDEPKAPTLKEAAFTQQAVKLNLTSDVALPNGRSLQKIDFTDAGTAVLTLKPASQAATRSNDSGNYINGTYTVDGDTYYVQAVGLDKFVVVIESKNGKLAGLVFKFNNGEEINAQAEVGDKLPADEVTKKIVGKWGIKATRIRHTGDVKGVKDFAGCNLNEILAYAKSKAEFDEEFETGEVVTALEFTSTMSFYIYYKNGNKDCGTWAWVNKDKGTIKYHWEEQDMGNKFMNGEAVFDVREGYYCLTLSANIETRKQEKYDVSSTWFLVQQ